MNVPHCVFCIIIPIFISIIRVQAEVFTALVHMERVLQAESDIAKDLKDYIQKEEDRINKLKRLAEDFEQHSTKALANPEVHLGNPLNAFLLMKRFTTDWDNAVDDLIRRNSSEEFFQRISSLAANFPGQEDLSGAATALLRLQDTYALPTEKLASGEIQGITNSPRLSAHDCFELGRIAYNGGDYYHCVLWMEEGLQRMEQEYATPDEKSRLLDYLSFAVYKQGNVPHARNLTIKWLELEPDHARARQNLRYYDQMLAEEEEQRRRKGDNGEITEEVFQNKRPIDDYRGSAEFQDYEALCRGETTKPIPNQNKLVCRLRRDHPLFILTPAKEELAYYNPNLYFYHHMMTDSEIAKVKELATPKLHRSGVFIVKKSDSGLTNNRISKSAWLKDEEHPLIAQLTKKTAALSLLSTWSVEELQVLNYGIGGHYEPHFDFARKNEKNTFDDWRGNRIATTIFYMTDVEYGGCTVFPEMGVRLCPEKGGMAMWYNLKKSGEGDYMTRHAACPVVSGNKWVCNKWYHERGNEFMRPCGLSEDE